MFRKTSILRVLLCSLALCQMLHLTTAATTDETFTDKAVCNGRCRGLHDMGCFELSNGRQGCRCLSGYYSTSKQCQAECEQQQYWSLFTYGSCVNVHGEGVLAGSDGLCHKLCVFRVRLWATIFTIILFLSALALLLMTLFSCISSCYACKHLKKQSKRQAEEDVAVAQMGQMDPQGSMKPGMSQQGGAPAGAGYPYYGWPYYSPGRM